MKARNLLAVGDLHVAYAESRRFVEGSRPRSEEDRLIVAGDVDHPVVPVSHHPPVREPTRVLRCPEFAQWCGTQRTADWHLKHRAAVVGYGHPHIPRTTWHDGVRFEAVSWGHPREWRRRGGTPRPARSIILAPELTS
ncbi:hypothetical protein [Streptosporangium sp. CA-115845]|uniref:hypothetical protein n=1 Tax=Streptosporangium sp. CA-115845 TaxID=3240071 RepID=UPI003D8E1FB9